DRARRNRARRERSAGAEQVTRHGPRCLGWDANGGGGARSACFGATAAPSSSRQRNREQRAGPRLPDDFQARELQEKRERRLAVLVSLVDVEPVPLVQGGDVRVQGSRVRLGRVDVKQALQQALPVERPPGRLASDRDEA